MDSHEPIAQSNGKVGKGRIVKESLVQVRPIGCVRFRGCHDKGWYGLVLVVVGESCVCGGTVDKLRKAELHITYEELEP